MCILHFRNAPTNMVSLAGASIREFNYYLCHASNEANNRFTQLCNNYKFECNTLRALSTDQVHVCTKRNLSPSFDFVVVAGRSGSYLSHIMPTSLSSKLHYNFAEFYAECKFQFIKSTAPRIRVIYDPFSMINVYDIHYTIPQLYLPVCVRGLFCFFSISISRIYARDNT